MTDFGERVSLHSATHEDAGIDELDFSGLVGRVNFVDRGDPTFFDFGLPYFITDGNWNDLDLSSILPKGNIFLYFLIILKDDAVNSLMEFRKKGNSNSINITALRTQVADILVDMNSCVICDSNRLIEYRCTNTTWHTIGFVVLGWFP